MPLTSLFPAALRRSDVLPALLLVLLLASSAQLPGSIQCAVQDDLRACLAGRLSGWLVALASLLVALLSVLLARRALNRPTWPRAWALTAQVLAVATVTLLFLGWVGGDGGQPSL